MRVRAAVRRRAGGPRRRLSPWLLTRCFSFFPLTQPPAAKCRPCRTGAWVGRGWSLGERRERERRRQAETPPALSAAASRFVVLPAPTPRGGPGRTRTPASLTLTRVPPFFFRTRSEGDDTPLSDDASDGDEVRERWFFVLSLAASRGPRHGHS